MSNRMKHSCRSHKHRHSCQHHQFDSRSHQHQHEDRHSRNYNHCIPSLGEPSQSLSLESSNRKAKTSKNEICAHCLPHEPQNRPRPRTLRNRKHVSHHEEEVWVDGPMLNKSSPSKQSKKQDLSTRIQDPFFNIRNQRVQEWMHHHNYPTQHNSSTHLNCELYDAQEEDSKSETARSDSCVAEFPRSLRLEEFLKQLIAVTSQSDQSSESRLTNNLSQHDKAIEEVRSEEQQGLDTGIGTTSGSPSDQEGNSTHLHRHEAGYSSSSASRIRSASCSSTRGRNQPYLGISAASCDISKQMIMISDHQSNEDVRKRKPRSKFLQAFCCSRQ